MSLNSILGAASSGLFAAQTQLKVVSDNIANVNTPGYAQEVVSQTPVAGSDLAGGVQIGQVTRVVDQFLQQASLNAQAQSGSSGAMSSMLDQAQQLFGDPSTSTGYFSQLEQTFADITSAIQNPSSTVPRDQVVADVQNFLSQSSSISNQLQQLSVQADSQISDNVTKANNLLSQISQLNQSIVAEKASGGGAAGSQNAQSALVDQLSSLLDVKVSARGDGGVDIRAGDGSLLVGTGGAATLSYSSSGSTAGQLMVTQANGQARQLTANSGALQGLLAMRNQQLPSISSQLDQYVSQAVDQINRAHNASTAVPPPNTLTGANTGLDLPTALSGFTGKSSIGVVDQNGVVQQQVDIDFGAGKMSINGSAAAAVSFTPSTFLATLNTELGGKATASFSNGALSISAASSTNGIAIGDDATTPSGKAGRGFSDFFGLNDLITSSGYPNAGTGLQGTDSNGFTAGGQITIRLQDANGSTLRLAQVTVPSGGTMSGLVAALNSSQTGVGLYGAFNLDSKGQLTFAPSQHGVSMTVMGDNSQWGTGGPSISQLFGLSSTGQSPLAQSFSVRADIADDSMKLALGQFDPTIGAGNQALAVGNSRGGQLLANIGQNTVQFSAAGSFGALSTTLSNYGAQFAGAIAQKASSADSSNSNAQSLATEAQSRRSSVEGVSMDQELVNLTTYQQAYNANARLVQAVSQLYQTLLNIREAGTMERVTTYSAYNSVISNLLQAENNQNQADVQVSSGKVASDLKGFGSNAEALTAAQSLKTRVDGYVQTATNVATQLTAQDTALTEVSDAGLAARQAVAQAIASGSADGLMSSLQSAFSQAVDGLNTQYNGSYLFSGSKVTTPAVSVQSVQTMSATFQNDQNAGAAQLNETTKVPTGQLASNIGGALFTAFSAIQALNAGTPLSGPLTSAQMSALTGLLQSFDSANSGITQAQAQNGLAQNQVDTIKDTQTQRQTDLTNTIADMANVDMGQASANLAQAQTALQASARVFQTLQSTSLLNYLPNG